VRIEGVVRQLPAAVAQDYWTKRPIASRIGSKLSEQSHEIPSREVFFFPFFII
jgi:pyridoxine/pyridoxamine 5'-phosphate oxidase